MPAPCWRRGSKPCGRACAPSCRCPPRPTRASARRGRRARARPRNATARAEPAPCRPASCRGPSPACKPSPMKRFYKETAVDAGYDGYRVLLDGKPMRTPAKAVLAVPTRALAEAIAAEWQEVPDKAEINVSHLPLTRLAATAVDRVTIQRERVIDDTAKYAGSDMLCYRAPAPSSLVELQHRTWQPLLDWAVERYGAKLIVAEGTTFVAQPADA